MENQKGGKQLNHETCGRCGRKLKTEKSKEIGYGPVCHKKVLAAANEVPAGQTVIDEFIGGEKS